VFVYLIALFEEFERNDELCRILLVPALYFLLPVNVTG